MTRAEESKVTLTLALDTLSRREHGRAQWAQALVGAVEAAAPHMLHVEGYELGDTLMVVRLRSNRPAKTMKKLLREDMSFKRLRARLADMGARSEFDVEEDRG